METQRLTHASADDDGEPFEIVNLPLHKMNAKTQNQIKALIHREHLMRAVGKPVSVEFQAGPLGLQLADVGKRVLVTALENTATGEPGQAERSGLVEIGYQFISIGGKSTLGLPMREVLVLIKQLPRPVLIVFQPLIIPRAPEIGFETIFEKLGKHGILEESGEPFEVEFQNKFIGLNIGAVGKLVVVSQFVPGGDKALLEPISLGARVAFVKSRKRSAMDREDALIEWVHTDCQKLDYAEVAGIVREAGRPVRIGFVPMKVTIPDVIQGKKVCSICRTKGPPESNFCWKCGTAFSSPGGDSSSRVGDLIGLDVEEDACEEKGGLEQNTGVQEDEEEDLFGTFNGVSSSEELNHPDSAGSHRGSSFFEDQPLNFDELDDSSGNPFGSF